ncbi:hypothetical protein cypCar_00036979 [Cyprinus carpio]|uniref:Uncharacterized protein LOC109058537 isoform X1 n=2 Tax=Cyprinus carpio TaxID=7962 RepID=A0A9Q9WFH4_CYPCA|nr:uncharacterized protein LOC109058537 isoform X1 [Cyprinus carpio]XP_042582439.1 uncharacterized protein LOC109058537 isoform X1 [Cyprinus carpio]XP_042582440.1 uncharacterized protein LOC109058537 isoform X1 [Cyprinus carpio]XP_042582441.1 uncharacterized protein LOC109058537 isoform X1 [Cyprinus carpio]KTG44778.1 hypothetical protein cypCar_00036979 [Cyprinus carpio]
MAEQSPAKKLRKQVKGFLCNVSPIKDTYFDAVLQHEGGNSKVVVFRPEDHMHFHNAEKTRSLVTLEDVVLQSSIESSRRMDIFYTHSSKMSCVRNLGEAFNNCFSAGPQAVQLSELLKLHTKPKRVNINAKIIQEVRRGNSVIWDRQNLPRTEYTVADTTGCMSLTVWCEHSITVGEWYNITDVSVREISGKTSLSTTKDTQIVSIPSLGTAAAVQVPTETIRCDIIGANIKNLLICPRKHKLKNVTLSSPTLYCISCNTHYKSTAIIMNFSGHLDLKPETGNVVKAKIEDEVIRSALTVNPTASPKDIIKSLIALPAMQITIRENVIVKMEDVPQKTDIKSEDEPPIKVEPVKESKFYSLFNSQARKRTFTD